MPSRAVAHAETTPETRAPSKESVYREGIVGGLLGGVTIVAWFFLLDLAQGRPLYTPMVLATALFRGGAGLESMGGTALPVSFELVFLFTWVHFLVFAILGGIVSRLLAAVERNPSLGFGILLLFVYLMGGFLVASFLFAHRVLDALAWPSVAVGNLLAAAAMVVYFRKRHPNLRIPA